MEQARWEKRADMRRSTKEDVITAQQGPDERALMTEADGAPLPNEQVSLMRNAKWNGISKQTDVVQITLWLDLFLPLKYLVKQILNKSSTKWVVRQPLQHDTHDCSQNNPAGVLWSTISMVKTCKVRSGRG